MENKVKLSEDELISLLLNLEYDLGLFEWVVKDIRVWQYVRFGILNDVRCIYYDDKNKSYDEKSCRYLGKMTPSVLWDKYVARNDRYISHKDILLVSHSRKVRESLDYFRDSYVYWIDRYLNRSHIILDANMYDGEYVRQRSRNIITRDLMKFMRRERIPVTQCIVSKYDLDNKIIQPIENLLGITISTDQKNNWIRRISYIINYKPLYDCYYRFLLDKITPKIIILPNGYNPENMFLFSVAKNRGIPTVELEHGVATDTHYAYNYIQRMELESFPDYFFAFGNYEVNNVRWPIDREHIIPVGFPELEQNVKKYKKPKRNNKKNIVFISSEFRPLDSIVKQVADILDPREYNVIYRLHPKESNHCKTKVLLSLSQSEVEVVDNSEKSLYECLGLADWVVGMSSTALYEATAFDVKVAIIDHPFSIHSKSLYESGKALLVKDARDLANQIKNNDFIPNEAITFFEDNSLQNMEYHIERIIKDSYLEAVRKSQM